MVDKHERDVRRRTGSQTGAHNIWHARAARRNNVNACVSVRWLNQGAAPHRILYAGAPHPSAARQTESVREEGCLLALVHPSLLPPGNGARTGACAWRASTERAQESVGFREGVIDSRSCSTGVVEGCIPTGFPEHGAGCDKRKSRLSVSRSNPHIPRQLYTLVFLIRKHR